MNRLLILAIISGILFTNNAKADTNHFGAGGVFELDLGDSEILLTPKQEREQKVLEEQLKKEEK